MPTPQQSSYELELVFRGDPSTTVEKSFTLPSEVQAFVARSLEPNSVLTVAHMRGGADYGNFIIFVNEVGSAHVRLLEHQGFYAKRSAALSTNAKVQFIGDVGGVFEVDENATIPSSTATEALNHWLTTGGQLPTIHWGEE